MQNNKLYKAIVLNFGYAESNSIATLIFTHCEGFTTRKEAIHSFVNFVYNEFLEARNRGIEISNKYMLHECPSCGSKYYLKKYTFREADWKNYLLDIMTQDIDSYFVYDSDPAKGWECNFEFDITSENMVMIRENAAEILTVALFEIHPELKAADYDDFYETEYEIICDESLKYKNGQYQKGK